MSRVSLLLVAHRSSALLPAAVTAFRRELAALFLPGEVVVVEHSEDSREVDRVEAAEPEVLLVRPNRGYAAGLNAGLEAATGDVVLLANPDVELAPGALGALLAALDDGWDVVGPLFHLGPWLFPPSEPQTLRAELRRWLATRGRPLHRRYLARELRRSRALWAAPAPLEQGALSGALLALRRPTAREIGPWDEGYFLYFEEADWLRRAARLGLSIAQVPAARARHCWGHAARPELHQGTFAASRRRFYAGAWGSLGRALTRLPPGRRPALPPLPDDRYLPAGPEVEWLLSPSPWGFPAAWGEGVERGGLGPALDGYAEESAHGGELTVLAWDRRVERLLGAWAYRAPSAAKASSSRSSTLSRV